MRCDTNGCCASWSAREERSFHITNLPNEKWPSAASGSTAQPSMLRTASRKDWNTSPTATPELSSGSGSTRSTCMPNSERRNSRSVAFTSVSSSSRVTAYPSRTFLRESLTGISMIGAR